MDGSAGLIGKREHLRAVRIGALALASVMASLGAVAACGSDDASPSSEVDPGPTFGIEVTLTIAGRGRVHADPPLLDCPGTCFARFTSAERTFDSSDTGLAVSATPSPGSRFTGWTFEVLPSGVRARGPSQCSPMLRFTQGGAPQDARAVDDPTTVRLPYGETEGTPPKGLEQTCAAFTTVPVAYALTATFVEDAVVPDPAPAPDPPIEVLFEPPTLGNVASREIAVHNGRVYWRFDHDGASGIAMGKVDGSGGTTVPVSLGVGDTIQAIDLAHHVVFQHGSTLELLDTDTNQRIYLSGFPPCAALTSDGTTAYCRYLGSSNGATFLYTWPTTGGPYTYLYTLPYGVDLAVDQDNLYFSSGVPAGGNTGGGIVESAPRVPDGGSGNPVVTTIAARQTLPRALRVGPSNLFWIDQQGTDVGGFGFIGASPKIGTDGGAPSTSIGLAGLQDLALDPGSPTVFYAAVRSNDGPGGSRILTGSFGGSSFTLFRGGLAGIGGVAVDAVYVYWTQSDGRVYRAPKPLTP